MTARPALTDLVLSSLPLLAEGGATLSLLRDTKTAVGLQESLAARLKGLHEITSSAYTNGTDNTARIAELRAAIIAAIADAQVIIDDPLSAHERGDVLGLRQLSRGPHPVPPMLEHYQHELAPLIRKAVEVAVALHSHNRHAEAEAILRRVAELTVQARRILNGATFTDPQRVQLRKEAARLYRNVNDTLTQTTRRKS